jgi:hypothetical protein
MRIRYYYCEKKRFLKLEKLAGGTFQDGWKCTSVCPIIGPKAREKGRKTAEAILARSRTLLQFAKLPDFTRTFVQLLGSEEAYGSSARSEMFKV